MDNEYIEYETFMVTKRDGGQAELAVVDRFQLDDNYYIAAALVVGDTISEDGVFIYKSIKAEDAFEFSYEQIEDPEEYARVAEYYGSIEEE